MDTTPVPDDFSEFLRCLNENGVEYLVIGGVPVNFIGLDDLRRNKLASGRKKDLADLDYLPEV